MSVHRQGRPRSGYLFKRWKGRRLRPDSAIRATYYVQLPQCDGVRRRVTVCLHTDDYEEALREYARVCGPLKWSPRMQYLRSLVDLGAWATAELDAEKGRANGLLLGDAWQAYLDSRRRPKSGPATLDAYRHYWNTFAAWAGQKVRYCRDVSADMADLYARDLDRQPIRAQTVNKHLMFLRLAFRVLVPESANPFIGLSSNKAAQRDTHRPLHPDEVRELVATASGEMRLLVLLGYCTGLRLGDCATLDWSAVDLEARTIVLVPAKTARRARRVAIPIHPQLLRELVALETARIGPVLPSIAARYRKRRDYVQKDVAKLLARCGIRKSVDGSVGFHSLRHSYDSALKNAGVPASIVMALLGHQTPAVSARYFHADPEASAAAVVRAIPVVT